ncbi:MAG TPA: hypothetical protein PLI18_13610 [Pirellulaceae bacterium]|nr:hypothetical protein [Pirellulaceae bacterium]
MSKYLGLALLLVVAVAASGCRCRERGILPGWFRTSYDSCATDTVYDPAVPYMDGGYDSYDGVAPGPAMNVLPQPGN